MEKGNGSRNNKVETIHSIMMLHATTSAAIANTIKSTSAYAAHPCMVMIIVNCAHNSNAALSFMHSFTNYYAFALVKFLKWFALNAMITYGI